MLDLVEQLLSRRRPVVGQPHLLDVELGLNVMQDVVVDAALITQPQRCMTFEAQEVEAQPPVLLLCGECSLDAVPGTKFCLGDAQMLLEVRTHPLHDLS